MQDFFINVPDFPIEGFEFPDITPLFENNPTVFKKIIDRLTGEFRNSPPDYILCIESFGYLFGAPLAYNLGCKIILCRKKNHLPRETFSQDYNMCYDKNRTLEIHKNSINSGSSVLIIDDFLASGGTSKAACELVLKSNAKISAIRFIAEIIELNGMKFISHICNDIDSILKIKFDADSKQWQILNSKL